MQNSIPDEFAINNNSFSHCSLNSRLLSLFVLFLVILFCIVRDKRKNTEKYKIPKKVEKGQIDHSYVSHRIKKHKHTKRCRKNFASKLDTTMAHSEMPYHIRYATLCAPPRSKEGNQLTRWVHSHPSVDLGQV